MKKLFDFFDDAYINQRQECCRRRTLQKKVSDVKMFRIYTSS